jgi:alpha-galactosidase
MKILGRPLSTGRIRFDDGQAKVDAVCETIPGGYRVTGTVRGCARRIEVFRMEAPQRFLMNNWQSWGPMQVMGPQDRLAGLEERMANYGRYVFTPIPDLFAHTLVSDYFAAWEGVTAGFLSSREAHPYFAVEGSELIGCLDYFGTRFDHPVPLEPLVLLLDRPVEISLEEYAALAAAENEHRPARHNPVGWSSWYQYFTNLTAVEIEKNLRLARGRFPFEVFQIDDGYERDIGDWLDVKEGFIPLSELADLIRSHGFVAGIWTAPFSASESSDLFRLHPGWFVAENGRPKVCYRNWNRSIFALDTTHSEVLQWLFDTFAAFRRMGFHYFKIDFLFAGAMPGVRHESVSPIQAYRQGMEAIRRAVGDNFVLGCGAPLLPSIGFIEGMRIGEDTAPFWNSGMSGIQGPNAYIALKNPILRYFMHGRWWLNDPDCLLLRERDIGLSLEEKQMIARVSGALDNMLIESDDLELVGEQGKALLLEAIGLRGGSPRVAGIMEDDAYVIESADSQTGSVRLAVNLSDTPKRFDGLTVLPRSSVFL